MSCSPCGYTYTSSPQFLMTGQHPSIPYPTSNAMPPESIHGSNVCSLPYADARFLGSAYPRISDLYAGAGYPEHMSYMSGLSSHSVLYPASLPSPYDIKDPRWTIPPAAGYPCDPTFAAYGPYGDRYDPVDSEARRRNATRETTSTLKAWLNEHRKNPYPTKGEKIMLAIITKMTLTQVSTWFANARRRLKKENKMTWEPRNKTGDDLDDVSIDEDEDKDEDEQKDTCDDVEKNGPIQNGKKEDEEPKLNASDENFVKITSEPVNTTTEHVTSDTSSKEEELTSIKLQVTDLSERRKTEDTIEKPKIWSLAQTATSESPPTSRKHHLDHSTQDDLKRFRRMAFQEYASDGLLPTLCHRNIPRLHTDSSTESSLSSPPLWRASDIHTLSHSDKYGRVTPLDTNDIVSVSPSSTGSPAMVSSSIERHNSLSPSMQYSRLLGCRLLPGADSSPCALRPPTDHSHYYTTQTSSLDFRAFHPSFLKASPFTYSGGFSAPPPPPIQQTSLATISKGKTEEASQSKSDS